MKRQLLHGLFVLFALQTYGQEIDSLPCTGTQGLVVNFDKKTNTIVETECDSIQFLAEYIQGYGTEEFAIIGIVTDRDNIGERKKALKRAERVSDRLIEMGIPKNQLMVYTTFFKAPSVNDHRDWPFYPMHFTYEIGVYLQPDL